MLNVANRMRRKVSAISSDEPRPTADPVAAISGGHGAMRAVLKKAASALKRDQVPFALAGSYALWVHGAPEGDHDVDVAVAETDVEDATRSLTGAGFEIERPPEDWLVKAYDGGVLVDVLHRLVGEPIERGWLEQVAEHDVLGLRIPVLEPTDVVITKLRSMSEHYCDFGAMLPPVRAVREQLDWGRVRAETEDHPYAAAFVYLLDRLSISGEG
jgi:hypothetical protein